MNRLVTPILDYVKEKDMEINLLNYFDKAYCINLDKRTDRWLETHAEFERCNIKGVERYSAIDGATIIPGKIKSGALALKHTFVNIIKEAQTKGYKNICIFEDDVVFCNEYTKFDEYMKSVPENWDILYLGTRHLHHPILVNNNIVKVIYAYTAHSIVINSSMYNRIIYELGTRDDMEIDVYLANQHRFINAYSFYPNITNQRPSFSNIELCDVNYTHQIDQRFNF